jgi:G:T/U-mismatch repair DNA glycosylase
MRIKEIIFWRILYTILNAMPISEIFEEKIHVLQANKIGLWDLENCERQGSLDIHIKTKRKMILNLYLDCSQYQNNCSNKGKS